MTLAADGSDPLPLMLAWRRADGRLVGRGGPREDISAYVAGCRAGVAVPDPEENPGLLEYCKTLLEVQNALAGRDELHWFVEWSMSEWEGVVVEGSPPRVTEMHIESRRLRSEIPSQLSRLTALRVLDMSNNALIGAHTDRAGRSAELGEAGPQS